MEDIEDFKKSIGKKSRLLGIDPGKKGLELLYQMRTNWFQRP